MNQNRLAAALAAFGAVVIGSGLVRYLTTPAGQNGLYFGLVMGGAVLSAALLAWLGKCTAARAWGGVVIGLIVLWFGFDTYRDLAAQGTFGSAEIRKGLVILHALVTAVCLCLPFASSAGKFPSQR